MVAIGTYYDQLVLDDQVEIYRLHEAGKSRREIARLMGRHPTTIWRELKQNSLPKGGYKATSAERMALSRCRRVSRIERLIFTAFDGGSFFAAAGGAASPFSFSAPASIRLST